MYISLILNNIPNDILRTHEFDQFIGKGDGDCSVLSCFNISEITNVPSLSIWSSVSLVEGIVVTAGSSAIWVNVSIFVNVETVFSRSQSLQLDLNGSFSIAGRLREEYLARYSGSVESWVWSDESDGFCRSVDWGNFEIF